MKSNQKGFSAVEIVVVIVVVGLLGIVGRLVYDRQNSNKHVIPNKNTPSSDTKKSVTTSPSTLITPTPDPNTGYLVVKEWGVKIKMKEAAKVTYTYGSEEFDDPRNGEHGDSGISLEVKPEYLQDKTCKVSVGWARYKTIKDSFFLERARKIGDYYFMSSGSPYNCGNDADNALNQSIRNDFGNLEVL